jgi:putative mRNA 3-end processing factor
MNDGLRPAGAGDLLQPTAAGLYCPAGDFYIDPRRPVARAIVSHGHADHARPGSDCYLAAAPGAGILRRRLGAAIRLQTLAYGERLRIGGVTLSLHPAGHILGSAQVRLELGGEVWAVTGDFKTDPDPTCAPFEPVRCHTLVTECTFGLPIFHWPPPAQVMAEIRQWWQDNRAAGKTSVLFAYALGKAQRVLADIGDEGGAVFTHGAVETVNACYREAAVRLAETRPLGAADDQRTFRGALVVAPPSADHAGWLQRFPDPVRGFASGWMRIRGQRRRRGVHRGFVLSDHADWSGLKTAVAASGAGRVWATHGYAAAFAGWLRSRGVEAAVLTENGVTPAAPPAPGAP